MIAELFQVQLDLPEIVDTGTKAFNDAFYKAVELAIDSSIESYGIQETIYATFGSFEEALKCEDILNNYLNGL